MVNLKKIQQAVGNRVAVTIYYSLFQDWAFFPTTRSELPKGTGSGLSTLYSKRDSR